MNKIRGANKKEKVFSEKIKKCHKRSDMPLQKKDYQIICIKNYQLISLIISSSSLN